MTSATRERLISAGLQLFAQHGIGQVGLDRVLKQAELTKTTFYNHFSGKEELIREAISRREQELRARLKSGVQRLGGDDPREQLLAVFDVLAELHDEAEPKCALMLNAIFEFPAETDPTRLAAVRCKESLNSILQSLAEQLDVESPKQIADQLIIILDGALIRRQVTRSSEAFRVGRELAERLL